MRPQAGVIALLNDVLTNELTSVNQYFLHARMYQNWGFAKLGAITYEESIGETLGECLMADLSVEVGGRVTQIETIKACEETADFVSRQIVREILTDTEEHIDFLETQLSLLKALGEANYAQSAMGELEGGES